MDFKWVFPYFLMTLLGVSGLFLIGLILLQRGRGGGLAGAFGGMGGQSAFGTKAGDVFTRITIGVASAWILLCAGSVLALHHSTNLRTKPDAFRVEEAKNPVKKAGPKDDDEAVKADDALKGPEKEPAVQPKTKEEDAPVKTNDNNPEGEKKAPDAAAAKPTDEKPADEKPKGDAKPDEDAKPKDDPKPKDGVEGDKKPDEAKPEPKPE